MKETIICAAVRAKDGLVVNGHRHADALRALQMMRGRENERPYGDDQGFTTSRGRYVDRKEAYKIFVASGAKSVDYKYPIENRDQLYSEDLY